MATIGLFSQTPYGLQQERQSALEESAAAYGKTNPNDPYGFDRARSGLYMAGSQLGGGIASLMGVEDPAMKDISFASMLRSKYNGLATTADVQGALREAIASKNPAAIQYLSTQLPIVQKAEADLKNLDPKLKIATAALAHNTPASIQNFLDTGKVSDLERIDKTIAPTSDFIGKAVELGFGEKSKYGDYTPAQVKAVNEELLSTETKKRKAGVQPVQDIARILDAQGAKQTSEEQAKTWSKAGDVYKTQVALVPKLDKVIGALPNTYTGKFSDTVTQFGKALAGAGVPIDTTKISNTEYVNSVTAQLVRQIARDFPGSQSNAELQQLLLSKPSTQQEYTTMFRLLEDVQQEVKAGAKTYERLSKKPYAERFKTDYNSEVGQTYKALGEYKELESLSKKGKLTKAQAERAKALEALIGD